jgi:hypothetical protein
VDHKLIATVHMKGRQNQESADVESSQALIADRVKAGMEVIHSLADKI